MYTINIDHRQDGITTYQVYRQDEADKEGIEYKHWKEADKGEYGVSDDGYVAKVISRREYDSNHDIRNIYIRFPWGYTFYNPKYPTKKLKASGRKSNTTFTGKSRIEVQSGQDKLKNLAAMFALKPDYDLAVDWALGSTTPEERRRWKRTMKSEVFKKMVREELQKLLTDHGLTEDYTLDLLTETIDKAKNKSDVTNLLRAVENLQDMHGMKDKHLVKTVDTIEAHSNTKLLDEIIEEEKRIVAQRVTTKEETPK